MLDLIFIALFSAAAGPAEPTETAETADTVTQPAAVAETTVARPTAEELAAARPSQLLRCRREAVTGSRMGVRVCTTLQYDQAAQDEAREELRRSSAIPAQGN